jgi:hypothetical protein
MQIKIYTNSLVMGWGICFALDESGRVYCADGCNWRARESDYDGFPAWPSARRAVLDYFEGEAHRELDLIRDEFPGTAAGLKEACPGHMRAALHYYERLSDDEKRELHETTLAELEQDLADFTESSKDAYDKYTQCTKAWKIYKKCPPNYPTAKTRQQELERLIEPLRLEYDMELWAGRYDTYSRNARKYTKLVKLEKQFSLN